MKYLKRFKTEAEFQEWKGSQVSVEEIELCEIPFIYKGASPLALYDDENPDSYEPASIEITEDIYLPTKVIDEYGDSWSEFMYVFDNGDEDWTITIPIVSGIEQIFEVKNGYIRIPKFMFPFTTWAVMATNTPNYSTVN